jgi:hypothetical protein
MPGFGRPMPSRKPLQATNSRIGGELAQHPAAADGDLGGLAEAEQDRLAPLQRDGIGQPDA